MGGYSDSGDVTTTEGRDGVVHGEVEPPRPGLVTLFPLPERADPPAIWRIRGKGVVGRTRDATVRLRDQRVSRLHAKIELRSSGLLVVDQASKHGTSSGGVPVTDAGTLVPFGSTVRFGDTVLLVTDDVEVFRTPVRRIAGRDLSLARDVVAGPTLARVWDQAARAALLKEPVLILGESGSGKECVARMIHAHARERGEFVGINVAAVPDSLFEAELFGHDRGAFTGATTARAGAFREAAGGVLFLDEIGDLRAEVQAKLLRALDLKRVRPLGSKRDVEVDTRIVSSTSQNLEQACEAGTFRRDLWYRLSGIVLRVPPLRERPEDVVLLAVEALSEQAPHARFAGAALEQLVAASFTGNVRQLRHAVTHALDRVSALGGDEIRPEHLPLIDTAQSETSELSAERIRASMAKAGGVVAHASGMLGVSRTTFYNALKRLNLDMTTLRK